MRRNMLIDTNVCVSPCCWPIPERGVGLLYNYVVRTFIYIYYIYNVCVCVRILISMVY